MIPAVICFKFKQGGGSESYTLDLIKGFNQLQMKPTVYSSSFDRTLPEYQLITPKQAKLSLIPKKLRLPFLSSFIKRYSEPQEILISMTHTFSDITICGGQHIGYLRAINKSASLLEKFKIWNERKAFENTQFIIAHSKLMKEELIELYQVPSHKIEVIYPPVDTQRFRPISATERTALRQKLGFAEHDIICLFPSTGHQRKGFEILKRFFEKTDLPVKLVVAGTPVEESQRIVSLGFRKDMPQLYQAADFTVMASIYEPFGLVGVESILSGTPVIFSQNMACVETFQGNFGFTFEREDPESLAIAMSQAVKSVQEGRARIDDPLATLNYNPDLLHHMNEIKKVMKQVSAKKL